MKASIRIGVMALMVLSILSSVALADPPSGGDAGDTPGSAANIVISPKYTTEWTIYQGTITSYDKDWYRPNTVRNDRLWYQIDTADWNNGARLDAFDGPYTNLQLKGSTAGNFIVNSADGSSYINVYATPDWKALSYQFALRVY
ncbi:MAG: hypothetical protein O8C62_11235 [Candidatus Methanoperedens sp.]|nr:hypothetical protein [Candidatus Methanoperedens sp.]